MPEYELTCFYVTGTLGQPLLRPFTALYAAAVIGVKTKNTSRTKTFRDKVKVLLNRNIGLYLIGPVFVKARLCSNHPRISLVTGADRRNITIGIHNRCPYRRIAK